MGYESHNINHRPPTGGWEGTASRFDALSQETCRYFDFRFLILDLRIFNSARSILKINNLNQ